MISILQMLLSTVLVITACCYRLTTCYIDQSQDNVLHDTAFGDGANLYQLDTIQRCLSETEIGCYIHEFGLPSANCLNPTHILGCGDNGEDIQRSFDSFAWDVFHRQDLKIDIAGNLYA